MQGAWCRHDLAESPDRGLPDPRSAPAKPRTSVAPGERGRGGRWESPQGQLRGQCGGGSVSLPGGRRGLGWPRAGLVQVRVTGYQGKEIFHGALKMCLFPWETRNAPSLGLIFNEAVLGQKLSAEGRGRRALPLMQRCGRVTALPGQCPWGCCRGDEAGRGSGVAAAVAQGPWHLQPPTAAPVQGLKCRDTGGLQQGDGIHAV